MQVQEGKKMIDNIKKRDTKILYILALNIFLFLVVCGCFLRLHFSADGYAVLVGNLRDLYIHLQNGRFVTYAMRRFFATIGLGATYGPDISIYFTLTFIIVSAVSTTLILREVIRFADFTLSAEILALLDTGIALSFINGFINDWYGFSDCMDFYAIAIAGASLAAVWTSRGNTTGNKWYYLGGFAGLFAGYNAYQVSIGLYVFWVMLFIWLHAGKTLDIQMVKDTAIALLLCILVCLSNILLVKLFTGLGYIEGSRYANMNIGYIGVNSKELVSSLYSTWIKAHDQLPTGAFCGMLLLVGGILLGVIIAGRRSGKQVVLQIIAVLLVLAGGCGAVYAPHLLSSTWWVTSRTVAFLFCIFGVLAVMCVFLCRNKHVLSAILAVYALFFLLNARSMQTASTEICATNAVEQALCQQMEYEISKYETATGKKIEKVGFVNDTDPMYSFEFVKHGYKEQGMNSLTISWERLPCLNYYTGKLYTEVNIPDNVYREYFEGKNWNSFTAEEQMVFDGDCVYIAIF